MPSKCKNCCYWPPAVAVAYDKMSHCRVEHQIRRGTNITHRAASTTKVTGSWTNWTYGGII
ncbi:hypothetical protein SAMN05216364_10885 [Porphyromonadaceae bacterium KHP3R9]|jgi:hypothetical protein|nr:hypothetical protein SAMN05216364_10885 [Porphyromonadaceae bacterium KHP3R9]